MSRKILWWGHFDADYSRNRVLRGILKRQGWQVLDFHPKLSRWADFQTLVSRVPSVDLVWVPCFRQRDLAAAVRWGRRKNIPVVFDPLISAYDKQVFEREKFSAESRNAAKLLRWEQSLFQSVDFVVADTWEHASFFQEVLGVDSNKLAVVPVGAEEDLFKPVENVTPAKSIPTVLFYGSFLNLQGPEVIIEAARLYSGPPVVWNLLGNGPLLDECRTRAQGLDNVIFLPWVEYEKLPSIIHQADVLLGVFGVTPKAGRVIPNKVFQSLACGKPLITRSAPAYPDIFNNNDNLGISWVAPGESQQLADKVAELVTDRAKLLKAGSQARRTYEMHFSMQSISASLMSVLKPLFSAER